ncbi:hypothetical protein G6F68_014816 [Rhizopus microsporus]|nr:hypothetical protein G6F68_014816 [Rhizopus microsporus]
MDTVSLGGAKRMSFSRLGILSVSSLSWIFSFVVHQLVPTKMAVGGGQRNLLAVSVFALVTDRLPFLCTITLLGHFTRQHDHRLLTQLSRGGWGDGVCKIVLNEWFDLVWG